MDRQARVWSHLQDVLDPETGVSVVDLGIVRSVSAAGSEVRIALDGAHPLARHFAGEAEAAGRDAAPGCEVVVELAH